VLVRAGARERHAGALPVRWEGGAPGGAV